MGVGEQPDGNNVINRSEYFPCQASIAIRPISGVNYANNSRNARHPGSADHVSGSLSESLNLSFLVVLSQSVFFLHSE